MKRVPEPELQKPEEDEVYARWHFKDTDVQVLERCMETFQDSSHVLDIGTGAAKYPLILLRHLPDIGITALDASETMVGLAHEFLRQVSDTSDIGGPDRIHLKHARFQDYTPPSKFDGIMSTDFLHHLPDENALREFFLYVDSIAERGAPIYFLDLIRPPTLQSAKDLVDYMIEPMYPEKEPGIDNLKALETFLNREIIRGLTFRSLLAAWTREEVQSALHDVGLRLEFSAVGRHYEITGNMPPGRLRIPTMYDTNVYGPPIPELDAIERAALPKPTIEESGQFYGF